LSGCTYEGEFLNSAINPTLPQEDTAVRYTLDAGMSRFRAQAFASGLLSAFGHNPMIAIRGFSGEARFDPNSLQQSYLQLTVDPESLAVENEISDKDRKEIMRMMDEEVLETSTFPEIRYECSNVTGSMVGEGRYWIVLNGNLTLHGETRPQKIVASLIVNGDSCQASGEFPIRQSDYKIKLVSAVGGGLKVKDEVKCSFTIMARKTE
jgi:polyisoprenoid-binding protein YceI